MVSRGWHGWVLVLVLVVLFDVFAATMGGESMTDAARRWYHHGVARWFVLALLLYLAAHLTGLSGTKDPLDRTYAWLRDKTTPTPTQPLPGEYPAGKG
jgi:hypothetical protein